MQLAKALSQHESRIASFQPSRTCAQAWHAYWAAKMHNSTRLSAVNAACKGSKTAQNNWSHQRRLDVTESMAFGRCLTLKNSIQDKQWWLAWWQLSLQKAKAEHVRAIAEQETARSSWHQECICLQGNLLLYINHISTLCSKDNLHGTSHEPDIENHMTLVQTFPASIRTACSKASCIYRSETSMLLYILAIQRDKQLDMPGYLSSGLQGCTTAQRPPSYYCSLQKLWGKMKQSYRISFL